MANQNEGVPTARIWKLYSVKQKFAELLDALPITTVGRDHWARRHRTTVKQKSVELLAAPKAARIGKIFML